ncbi:MAG: phosphate ABC transporter permease PstA [Oscillospiraceae bacterium]|jgi:phosphate transport system permease protein|nr:phosphate ABC transporter permease PstA [Oscillospiraceae bacterium]
MLKRKLDPLTLALRVLTRAAAAVTLCAVVFLIGYILVKGVPQLKPSLFALKYTSQNVSVMPALFNTLYIIVLALPMAVPLGVFSAVYLAEYAKRGNKAVRAVRLAAETLAGMPSIVYGLFGMLLFRYQLKWGYSLLGGACTLAVMVLPVIMRTTEEALLAVPDSYREGSFGLGAGRLRTVFRVVVPSAVPGILAGIILALGRIVGETVALLYTAGSSAKQALSPMDSGRTLAVHMYLLSTEGLHINETYATAVVLLVLVLGINGVSMAAARKLVKS